MHVHKMLKSLSWQHQEKYRKNVVDVFLQKSVGETNEI